MSHEIFDIFSKEKRHFLYKIGSIQNVLFLLLEAAIYVQDTSQ